MSGASKSGDEFASILNWREPVTATRLSRAAIGSIGVHILAALIIWFAPVEGIRTLKSPRVRLDTKNSVKLVAPRIVKELTQQAPNKGKVTHELDVHAALPGKPAPKRFEVPTPAGPANRQPTNTAIALPNVDVDLTTPQVAALPNGAPNLPRPPEPKLTLENVAPTPNGVPANPELRTPMSTSIDMAKVTGRPPGGGGGAASNGDNGDPGDVRNMQLLSDPQNIDFKPYMLQVLQRVRAQWFAVIPQIARTGRQGIVVLQFSVDRRGCVWVFWHVET